MVSEIELLIRGEWRNNGKQRKKGLPWKLEKKQVKKLSPKAKVKSKSSRSPHGI